MGGGIKDLQPLTTKSYHFVEPPSAIATGTAYLSLVSLTLCLSWSSGTCEAFMREWVLTAETDVTSGRAGTVTCQPLSCPRQCSLRWIRKSLIDIWTEIRCSSARAAVCPNHTLERSEKSSHKRCFRAGAVSQWPSYNKLYLAAICQVKFKPEQLALRSQNNSYEYLFADVYEIEIW